MAGIQVVLLILFVAIAFVGFEWWVQKKMIEHDKNDHPHPHPPSSKEGSNAKNPSAIEFTPLSFLQSMMVPSVHQEGFVNSSMQYQFI